MIAYDQQQEPGRRRTPQGRRSRRARTRPTARASRSRRCAPLGRRNRLRDEAAAAERAAQHARVTKPGASAPMPKRPRAPAHSACAAELEALAKDQTREALAADITAARAESKAESSVEEFRADELRGQAAEGPGAASRRRSARRPRSPERRQGQRKGEVTNS